MHRLVLHDDKADGHVAGHAREEDQHVDRRDGDQERQAHVLRTQDLIGGDGEMRKM